MASLLSDFGSTGCVSGGCARANFACDSSATIDISDLAVLLSHFGLPCTPATCSEGLTAAGVTIAVTPFDTGGFTGSGFFGESQHFVFDVVCTIAESGDDWLGSGVAMTAANGATFRLVPNAGNPPTPGSTEPAKYATFFSQPYAVNSSSRFTGPLSNGAIAGKHNTGTGAFTYTSTALNAAWYDSDTTSNDGPAAIFRAVIYVKMVDGANTGGGFGSVYFTTGSPGSGDIKVADMTFDLKHKYPDSGSTSVVGSFYVTD